MTFSRPVVKVPTLEHVSLGRHTEDKEIYFKKILACANAIFFVMVGHTEFVNKFNSKRIKLKSKH